MNKGKWLGKYSRPMEHLGRSAKQIWNFQCQLLSFSNGMEFPLEGNCLKKKRFPFFWFVCLTELVVSFLGSIYSGWLGIIFVLSDIPKALHLWRFSGGVVDGGPWFFNWHHFTTKKHLQKKSVNKYGTPRLPNTESEETPKIISKTPCKEVWLED